MNSRETRMRAAWLTVMVWCKMLVWLYRAWRMRVAIQKLNRAAHLEMEPQQGSPLPR
jgi:hypothetical protein